MATTQAHVARRYSTDESPLCHILATQAFLDGVCGIHGQQLTDENHTHWSETVHIALRWIGNTTAWDTSEATYKDLVTEITAYQARTAELERPLTEQRMISTRLAQLDGLSTAHTKPANIPDPDTFDRSCKKLRPFITKLRLNIAGNTNKFSDVQH